MAEKLNDESIRDWLEKRNGWKQKGDALVKEFRFSSFRNTIVFVNRIASLADDGGHRPGMDIRDEMVRLTLTTPEVKGISEKDLDMAQRIDFATSAR